MQLWYKNFATDCSYYTVFHVKEKNMTFIANTSALKDFDFYFDYVQVEIWVDTTLPRGAKDDVYIHQNTDISCDIISPYIRQNRFYRRNRFVYLYMFSLGSQQVQKG